MTAEAVLAPVFERWEDRDRSDPSKVAARVREYATRQRGRLKGRIVLIEPARELKPATAPASTRLDDAELAKLASAAEPTTTPPIDWPITRLPEDPKERERLLESLPLEVSDDYWQRQSRAWEPLWSFLREEGVLGVLTSDAYGRGGGSIVFAGATDNATGCAVMLEVMRILKALDLKLDRTVRLALWTGEEQGIYGSRAYVKQHFGDPVTMLLKPEHAKLAAYFNLDNGAGKIRGVYLQGNDRVRPIFEAWLAPFADLGARTLTIRDTFGTDHLPFDAVGLPGFQFIQDPLDYMTRTHHSDVDVYDHVQSADLMQAAAIVASFVYDAATREGLLPREPLPKPLPPPRRDAGAR